MSRRGQGRRRGGSHGNGWEEWAGGYMEAKKQKLKEQFEAETPGQLLRENSTGTKIFSGIVIHVNGYTKPSSDELKRLMMLNGGAFEHYLYRKRVTHVIATNLPDSKVRELKGLKVVRPEWITDSIKAGKLLSYTTYQLYTQQTLLQQGIGSFTSRENSLQSTSSLENTTEDQSSHGNSIHEDKGNQSNSVQGNNNRSEKAVEEIDHVSRNEILKQLEYKLRSEVENSDFSRKRGENADKHNTLSKGHNSTNERVQVHEHTSPAKAGEPRFLNEFYTNSRLHHLSTWKAEFREYVNHLQNKGGTFPGRDKLVAAVVQREATSDASISQANGSMKGNYRRCVMHIDMDCFFVSVGLRKRPDLKGKPVAVTHSKGKGAKQAPGSDPDFEKREWEKKRLQGRKKGKQKQPTVQEEDDLAFPDLSDSDSGDDTMDTVAMVPVTINNVDTFHSRAEIASCSYEARKAGVKNGMYMGTARQLCPDLKTIPYDFEGYQEVSKLLYDTVASYTHDIEAVSCDEMLVDCTDLLATTGATPLEFASILRQEILQKTGCTASAGMASNILVAKMATRKAKPNGQYFLEDGDVLDFIRPQSIRDIPGVGWSISKKFESMNVATCGDLQAVSMETLRKEFGPKTGQSLYQYCRGQDDRPIKMEHQRKSVSAEVNYGIRFRMEREAVKFVQELSEEVCSRLKAINMKGRSVTLKLMVRREDAPKETSKFMGHGICNHLSKSVTLPMATDDGRIVGKECVTILKQQKAPAEDLRGIGIQIQKLVSASLGTRNSLKGNQSILNFAVSRTTASHKSPPERESSKNSNSVQMVPTIRVSPEISNMNSKAGNQLKVKDTCTDEHVLDTDEISDVGITETDGEPMEEDEVLHVYSQSSGIVSEIASRKTGAASLPPLPNLPNVPTPETKKTPIFKSKHTASSGAQVDFFPSPSQVDPEVLNELPSEIREQIEMEMASRRKKRSRSRSNSSETSSAGCSHWQPSKDDNSLTTTTGSSKDSIVPLPSPSQLDMSCLTALPESLQTELKEAYERMDSKKMHTTRRNTNEKPLQLQQAKSPSKASPKKRSPAKGKSPQFKVPRGRPAGRGKKKTTSKKSLFKDQPKIYSNTSTNKQTFYDDEEQVTIHVEEEPVSMVPSSSADVSQEPEPEEAPSGVNLCGAVTLNEVRDLIKEWICSTPAPQEEDEEVLLKYLYDLVHDRNLEQVDLLLKFMHRNILYVNNSDWLLSLKRIFCQTQTVVKAVYGSVLSSIRL